ncbi:hypothetical protein BU25DRAFT_211805, partial [Macroventuria anomochaeta]
MRIPGSIMARIYAFALGLSIWLGKEADDSFSVLEMCRTVLAHDPPHVGEWQSVATKMNLTERALIAFMSRPWFRRVWRSAHQRKDQC